MTDTRNNAAKPRRMSKRFFTTARKKALSVSLALVLALSMPFAYATEGGELIDEVVDDVVVQAEAMSVPPAEDSAPAPENEPEPAVEGSAADPDPSEDPVSGQDPADGEEPSDGSASESGSEAVEPAPSASEAEGEAVSEPKIAAPLYVELYGDGFEAGDRVSVKIQKQEAGSFAGVKTLALAFGVKSDPVEDLEAGTYRVELVDEADVAELSLSTVVDGVEQKYDVEQGFAFDPEKGALARLEVKALAEEEPVVPVLDGEEGVEPEADAEAAAAKDGAVTVRVKGEGSVTMTRSDTGESFDIASGGEASVTQPVGTYLHIEGVGFEGVQSVVVSVENEAGSNVYGPDSAFDSASFFKDVTIVEDSIVVTVTFNGAPDVEVVEQRVMMFRSVLRAAASSGNWDQPEVGDSFSGSALVTGKEVISSGGMVDDIYVDPTSGILAGFDNITTDCAHHSAASPRVNGRHTYTYTYTVDSVNKATGEVTGTFRAVSDIDPTDERTTDSQGRLTGYQGLVASGITIWRTYQGYIDLQKESTCPDLVTSSDLYSLAGAEYGVYGDSACTNLITTLVTDASGYAKSEVLNAGTYYVKETKAPEGHYLDEKVYPVSVSGGTTRVNGTTVVDEAMNDPAAMWAGKIDKETTQNMPQGSATLADAEFTVKYYDGYYDTAEAAEASGEPTRTWVVKTAANGRAELADEYKLPGDDFYKTSNGYVTIPLGTIVIQETKAPEGYLLNDQVFVRQVTVDGLTGSTPIAYSAPVVEEQIIRGGISIAKTLEGGVNEELEGIAFFIYDSAGEKVAFENDKGETVDRLVLDAEGKASTADDALVYDAYTVVEDESSVPDDIIWYGDAQSGGEAVVGEVSIEEPLVVYNVDVVNYKKPSFELIKVDGDSLRDEGSEDKALKVEGSKWKLEFSESGSWIEIGSYATDESGRIEFGDQAISKWGTYRLTEVKPAEVDSDDGYMRPIDSDDAEFVEFTIDASTWEKFEAGAYEGDAGDSWSYEMVDGKPALVHCSSNWRYRDIEVVKVDEESGDPVASTAFSLWRYIGEGVPAEMAEGYRSDVHELYERDPKVEIDEGLWEKVDEGLTDDKGSVIFRGLTFGHYMTVEELPAPEYAYWWESDKSSWATYFFEVGELEQKQVQVYENMKITLETTVDKSTIERTSAAFVSLPDQNVAYNNVNIEEYRYDVSFTNGKTNVRADQYVVIDECEFTTLGLRLSTLTTPVVANDTDGAYNLWYQTNMTNAGASYSSASATDTNPENAMADGTNRISTVGWKLWSADLSTQWRQTLSVSDLGLAQGEYVTRLMLEFGSVEVGFATTSPLSYMVYSTVELSGDTVIPNTATSHITRNWNGGVAGYGLYDDAADKVETRVIETLKFEPGRSTWTPAGWTMVQTGDALGWIVAGLAAIVALGGAAALLARRRMKAEQDK